jgi:hypothetical protein
MLRGLYCPGDAKHLRRQTHAEFVGFWDKIMYFWMGTLQVQGTERGGGAHSEVARSLELEVD